MLLTEALRLPKEERNYAWYPVTSKFNLPMLLLNDHFGDLIE